MLDSDFSRRDLEGKVSYVETGNASSSNEMAEIRWQIVLPEGKI